MKTVKDKAKDAYSIMKADFGYKNVMAAPRLSKVVVSVGTGSQIKKDKNRNAFIVDRLAKITGQKPATRMAKQSVASFKIRQGDEIGVMVTMRGARMYDFLEKLFNISIPRTKDFRGIDRKVLDSMGNLTLSVREHTIFPETSDEDIKDIFSMAITIVTTAKTKAEAGSFFDLLGMPFKK
jgi:large subunit ribosomal protein L5